MLNLYRSFCISIFILFTPFLFAQLNCQITHYSGENGISHGTVTGILKDNDGFLWLGTWNGLNRFDGKFFKSYKLLTKGKGHLENQRITQIEEGANQLLWVKTYDKKVYCFDKKTERFSAVSSILEDKFNKKVIIDKIFSIPGSYVWLTTSGDGLYGIPSNGLLLNEAIHLGQHSLAAKRLNSDTINFLYKDQEQTIWIGTGNGLNVLGRDNPQAFNNNTFIGRETKGLSISEVREDQYQLYFTSLQGILIVVNKKNQKLKKLNIASQGINNMLFSNDKQAIYLSSKSGSIYIYEIYKDKYKLLLNFDQSVGRMFEDHKGNLWIEPERDGAILWIRANNQKIFLQSTWNRFEPNVAFHVFTDANQCVWMSLKGGGFGYYDYRLNRLVTKNKDHGGNHVSFPQQIYSSFFNEDIFWLGTEDKGLVKLVIGEHDQENDKLLQQLAGEGDPEVRSILEDSKKRIWIGTKGGKLLVKMKGMFVDAPIDKLSGTDLSGVHDLLEDKNGGIWIATKNKGLFLAKPKDKQKTSYTLTNFNKDNSTLGSNQIYSIIKDTQDQIWLGTFGGGLFKLNQLAGKVSFQNIDFNNRQHEKGSFNKIRDMALDKRGNIWIATTYGLVVYDGKEKMKTYRDDYPIENNLGANDLQSVFKSKNGDLWICTSGGGVSRAVGNPFDKLTFQNYTTAHGLNNDYVLSATEDDKGNIWFATEGGISKYRINSGHFYAVSSSYGQTGFSFSEKTVATLSTGEILWGTNKGVLVSRTGFSSKSMAHLVFSNLFVNNKEFDADSYSGQQNYTIQYTRKLLLNYDQNNISIDFTVIDYRHQKHNYLYRLVGLDTVWHSNAQLNRVTFTNLKPGRYLLEVKARSDLYKEEPYKNLVIVISPPWWKSYWAYSLYAIFFSMLLIFGWRILQKMLSLKNEIEVEKRVSALKMAFLTNVSHELRTPLTLIFSPIKKLIADEQISKENQTYAYMIQRNAVRMESFVNQLLDLRKIQENKFEVYIESLDIIAVLQDVIADFKALAKEREIDIRTDFPLQMPRVEADRNHLETIMFNVISNAIKYSPNASAVFISCSMQQQQRFTIRVSDQGIGIKQEVLPHIFDLFYVGSAASYSEIKSSGIGLSLTKELVSLHQGEIAAYNNADKGLSLEITLPIRQQNLFVQPTAKKHSYRLSEKGLSSERSTRVMKEKPVVLVVEDNEDLRNFLSLQLVSYYTVLTAQDGVAGLLSTKEHMPDLIISDIAMPKMDGIVMLDKIRLDHTVSHIPVVLLSAKHAIASQIEAMKYGADYYITKPFDVEFLLSSIANLLNRRTSFFAEIIEKKEIVLKPSDLIITDLDEEFLKRVVEVVEHKMSDSDFNIDMVAEGLCMSRNAFYKKFKSLTKLAPVEFVRDMRLQRAQQLLKDGMNNVSQVAYLVGFNNPKYFSTCFKEKYSISPKEFYKQHVRSPD